MQAIPFSPLWWRLSLFVSCAAGAEALDRKQRKQFDAWQLQNVKAAPQKPGRVSAAIGIGQSSTKYKSKKEKKNLMWVRQCVKREA